MAGFYEAFMAFFEAFKVLDSWEVQRLICGALREYHAHNLKNVKNTHRGVLILVKLQPF